MFFEKMQTRKNDGFTLVELIVVIAILAILAGIAVPAYSGYIEKANVATDEQLLHAVNIAFLSAAAEHADGEVNTADLSYGGSAGAVTVEGVASVNGAANEKVATAFATYYGENNTATFKTVSRLAFDAAKHMFVNPNTAESITLSYNGQKVTVSGEAIAALKNSAWGEMGAEDLLGMVANVSDLAASIDNTTFDTMIESEGFVSAALAILGAEGTTREDYDDVIYALAVEEANKLFPNEEDRTSTEYASKLSELITQIDTNTTIMVAAQNFQEASKNIIATLTANGGKDAKESFKSAMTGDDPANGLAQAALAYGLYTSYKSATDTNYDPTQPLDFSTVMNTLTEPSFQNYLNNTDNSGQAEKDLNGYLAAMNTITSNTGDGSSLGTDVAVSGFDDPALVALLQQAIGK